MLAASRRRKTVKRTSLAAMVAALLASCSPFRVDQGVISEIESATAQKGSQPDAVRAALLPPLRAEMPKVPGAPAEPRFDLVVNSAPARQVFLSIVSGTRYSMIVNPALGAFGLGSIATASLDASRVSMVSQSDLWSEVTSALRSLVGTGPGRNVVVSPQSGVIVVRAMPDELRNVDKYLKAMRLSIERQVMIEAKVVDVTLNNAYQAGINRAAFPSHRVATGVFGSNTTLGTTGNLSTGQGPAISVDPTGRTLTTTVLGTGLAGTAVSAAGAVGAGVFGLAIQNNNFAALLQFLESQGNVQVLSSPRVAALNTHEAVLKRGTDHVFHDDH